MANYSKMDFLGIFGLIDSLTGVDLRPNILESVAAFYLPSLFSIGLRSGIMIFIYIQFFSSFPKELEESGEIDGANSFIIFTRIILPCAVSMIVTAFLFSFVWQWTDTFYVNVFMPGNDFLSVSLKGLPNVIGNADRYYQAIMSNTSVILLVLPILIIFLFAQRFFVESIERAGLVG